MKRERLHPPSVTVLGAVGEPMTAVTYLRFIQPFRYLAPFGFRLKTLGRSLELERGPAGFAPPSSLLDGVSLVMFPQLLASPVLPGGQRLDLVRWICEQAARRGVKIVYSVDDHVATIEKYNPNYELVTGSMDNLETILEYADALIVTSPRLRDTLSHVNKPVHVLPNAIEPRLWKERVRATDELRVGWAGSSSHLQDLLMVLPAIRRVQRRIPGRFMIHGLIDGPISEEAKRVRGIRHGLSAFQRETADAFLELAGQLDDIVHLHVPFCAVDRFFDTLPALDLEIGICPLLDTEFNRHKSAVKFYEYAAAGSMTVASAVEPYQGEVRTAVANDTDAWSEILERQLRDPAGRQAALEQQREFVFAQRNIEILCRDWAHALTEILEGKPVSDREEQTDAEPTRSPA